MTFAFLFLIYDKIIPNMKDYIKENNLYIFQIDKITPATVQNIDAVKNSIIADLSNQKLIDEVAKLANKVALEIVAEPL